MNAKSVLISIQPTWCELIASGKKTNEVRKTRPKRETPFKCYIYQTKMRWLYTLLRGAGMDNLADKLLIGLGKVIGEFVCDDIEPCWFTKSDNDIEEYEDVQLACLSAKDIIDYGEQKELYFWHISNLVIYDKPKELSEFSKYGFDRFVPWKRPPQSWGYCQEGATDE